MATEYELTLADYLSILRRRAPYMIGIFIAVLLIAIVAALAMPPTYRSTGTIMVESQQVFDSAMPNIAKSQVDERINTIKQRVLTRESLLQIINKHGLFKERASSMTTSELIDKMRGSVGIELINVDSVQGGRSGKATIAFTLSFEDRYPGVAHQVTKDLVTLFLDWNVKLRTEGATETTFFFTQESDKLKDEVARLEGVIAGYKRDHGDSLPEQLEMRASMLARAENDLHEVERDIRSTNDALRSLEAELSVAKSGMGEDTSQTLPRLKAEYANLSAIYTESHPDIRALKRKIEALEQEPDTSESEASLATASSLAVYRIQTKIDAANARLGSLEQQKKILRDKIAKNEQAMERTPRVKQELDVLIRERDTAQKKYEELLGKKMNAQIAQSLESENKSERFTLLEPPVLPEKPFKPDRIKIIVLGFFLAMASSGGAIMVLESIDKRIRGAEALAHILGQRPMVIIPYLPILEDDVRRKRMYKLAIIAAFVALIVVAAALHFLYMPLDSLFMKIMARLS